MADRKVTVLNPAGYQELFQSGDTLVLNGDMDMTGNSIDGLPTPTADSEAASKGYVDSQSHNSSDTLQDVTDRGSSTTNAITVVQTGVADDAFVVNNGSSETFWVTGGGFIEATGDILINNRSGIQATGLVAAYRASNNGPDLLQRWQSNVGSVQNTIGTMSCDGTLSAVAFVGDGSGITGLAVAPVDSVNGQTGDVVLDYSDVGALAVDGTAADSNLLGGQPPSRYLDYGNMTGTISGNSTAIDCGTY